VELKRKIISPEETIAMKKETKMSQRSLWRLKTFLRHHNVGMEISK